MFRRFTDRITAAANAVIGNSEEEKVQSLQAMGFREGDARNALRSTEGDVERAAELLLASGSVTVPAPTPSSSSSYNRNAIPSAPHNNDAALRTAMQESLQTEEARLLAAAREASRGSNSPTVPLSAASVRAGQAAASRANNNSAVAKKSTPPVHFTNGVAEITPTRAQAFLPNTHPGVKVPARLHTKPQEEQLIRCADRMKANPKAVETLYKAMTAIQNDPDNDKFLKVDKTTAGYKRSLANVPGAEDFLRAMNFVARGTNELILHRDRVDPALLFLGISALEATRQTTEYQEAKRATKFEQQLAELQRQGDSSEQEAILRANHMAQCPTEPSDGRGATIQVKIGSETIRRRFDGDDTLEDVLNWIGGHGSAFPAKLFSREWSLIDMNHYPLCPLDCEGDRNKTLQYIGCFPSGRMEIVASTEAWHRDKDTGVDVRGSSRGLGAARASAK